MAEYIAAEAAVLLVPSTKNFVKALRADLEPQLAKFRPEVTVRPVLDQKALAEVAAEIESVKGLDKGKVRLGVTLDKSSLASSVAEIEGLQKAIGAKSVKIRINTDDVDSARKKTQSFKSELEGLSSQATKGILLRVAFLGLPAALAGIASLNTSIVELSRSALLLPGILAGGISVLGTLAAGAVGVKDAITAANKAQETAAQSAEKLANANRSVSDAQRDLNRAYKDAKRNLEDLYDQMRDAPLDEAEARLRLDEARTEEATKFGKTQLQQQKDTVARLRAQNELADAQQRGTRVSEDFADAQSKGITNSDGVVSATERLTKAVETLNQTTAKGSLSDEMAKLAPAGQAFVTQLQAMRTQWTAFRQDVQQHLFAGLDQEVTHLGTVLPNVKTGFDKIADSLNNNVKTAIGGLTSQGSKGLLDQIFGNTADAQRVLSTAIDPLIHSMLQLSSTGSGALPKLAHGFGDLAQTFDGFITKAAKDGSLDKWIDDGIKAAKDLGTTFLNIGKIMSDFSDIFTSAGGKGLVELLKDGTNQIHSFLTSTQGQTEVKQFFQDILEATRKWGPILHDIPGLLVNVVTASAAIGTIVLPLLRTMADLLSSDEPLIRGIITAFLAWKTFHPIITLTTGFLDKFKSKSKEASLAVGEEGAKGGLRGAMGSLGSFLKSAGWTLAIAGAIEGISKLGEAHDRATEASRKQQAQLEGLKGTLDQVTGSATPETIAQTSKAFQNYTLPSGKQVNLNSDAAGLGINPGDAVSAAADPTQQGKKDQILGDLDKKTQAKIEASDEYKRSKPFWDAAGIDITTLAKATNGDPSSVKRVQDALKTPVDNLPFGLSDAYKGLVNIIDGALPASATPGAAPSLQTFSDIAGASSSLALGVRDTSKGLGDQSRANANSSNVASGAPKGWQLSPGGPFSGFAPDGSPTRDASGQGFITLNSKPPQSVIDQWAQNGWTVSTGANGRTQVTVPPGAADQFLKPIPGFADGGHIDDKVWGQWFDDSYYGPTLKTAPRGGAGGDNVSPWPGGGMPSAASGGMLSGPGSGTSDSMLARVSDGEFISKASSVNKYGPDFYHALNSGAVDPGMLPGFDAGGQVQPGPSFPFPRFSDESPKNFNQAFQAYSPFSTGGPYQTGLSPQEESAFQAWVSQNGVHQDATYDWRGLWKQTGGSAPGDFQPDTYKTPYDPDFSGESKYSTPGNPFSWKDPATLIDSRDGSVAFSNPQHYRSDPGSWTGDYSPVQSIAPLDLPGFAGGGLATDIPLAPFVPVQPGGPGTPVGPTVPIPGGVGSAPVPGVAPPPLPLSPALPVPGTGLQGSPNSPFTDSTGPPLPVHAGRGDQVGPGGPFLPSPGGGAPLIAAGHPGAKNLPPGLPLPSLEQDVHPNIPDIPSPGSGAAPDFIPPGAAAPPPPPPLDIPPPEAPAPGGPLGDLAQVFNPVNFLGQIGKILLGAFLGIFGINPEPILGIISQLFGGVKLGGLGDPNVQKIIGGQPGRNQQFDPKQVGQLPGASGPPSGPPGAGKPSTPPGAAAPSSSTPGAGLVLPDGTKLGINPATRARTLPLGAGPNGTTTDAFDAAVRSGSETNGPLYAPGLNTGGYGSSKGLPDWAVKLGAQYGLAPSTYADGGTLHQRGYAFDFAPIPGNNDPVGSMDRFAEDIQNNFQDQTLELIHANSKAGKYWGVAGGQRVGRGSGSAQFPNYFDQAWTGHDDFGPEPHVHWATDVAPLTLPNVPAGTPPGGPAGLTPWGLPPAALSGVKSPVLNPSSNQADVARAIISQSQARGYSTEQQQAILSAAYQESRLSPTASGGGGAWHGIFQQDGGYAGRDDPNQNISAFLDRLGSHGGSQGDIWKNIFWLQQRPGEPSAASAFANGRQGYLSEIQSKLSAAQALYGQVAGHATGGMLAGPGSGTSDSILARVSDGEFITKAASVQKYGPDLFHALNNGVIDPGMLQGFAAGGQPDTGDDQLKKLLESVPNAGQVNGPLPSDSSAQHLNGSPDVSAQHLQGNGPLDFGSFGANAGQLTAPSPPPTPDVAGPPVTDVSPDPGAAPPTGASDQPDPRSAPAVAPTNEQQKHTAPWLDQALKQGIQYAGTIGATAASTALGVAGAAGAGPSFGGSAGASAAAAGVGLAISQGSQVISDIASSALNVLSSAGVGTLTPGTTSGAYGQPLLPQQQNQQTAGPAVVNNYSGGIHTASYDQFYQGQQRREAQQMAPYLTSMPG